jgi:hypothetical protein
MNMLTLPVEPVLLAMLRAAGLGQLVLVAASPAIPVVLRWSSSLAVLPDLLRKIFWTYAAYLLVSHAAFGALALLAPEWLLAGGGLAAAVCGFITAWWGVRLGLHVVGFETRGVAAEGWKWWAKQALGLLFAGLTLVYGAALWWNLVGGAG